MIHDQEEERDPHCLAHWKNLWMRQRDKENPLITGVALVRVNQTLQSGPCPLSSLPGPGLTGWQQVPSPSQCPLFSLWLVSLLDRCTLYLEEKKKVSLFLEKGVWYFSFERLQVSKYFYSWVIIWLVMKLPERNTFALAFWRHVFSSRFHHSYCDVWWYF